MGGTTNPVDISPVGQRCLCSGSMSARWRKAGGVRIVVGDVTLAATWMALTLQVERSAEVHHLSFTLFLFLSSTVAAYGLQRFQGCAQNPLLCSSRAPPPSL